MKDTTETPDSTETPGVVDLHTTDGRRGPTWRGWALSILVTVILSVTAMLLLGGSGAFRSDKAIGAAAGHGGSGAGDDCCPPADAGK
jgi:hypothetical protein